MTDWSTRLKTVKIERIHTWAFYLLCGFGLFSNISIAIANIFLGSLTALLLVRLWMKHDDWQDALPDGRLCAALFILMGAVVLSSFFSSDISYSLRTFGDYYGYRMIGLYAILLMVREKQRLTRIAACIAASFAINDLAVIYQGVFQNNFRAGGFSFSMSVGGFLSMLLPALLLLLLSGRLDRRWRVPTIAVFLLGGAALLFNGTRGAWLAIPLTMMIGAAFLVRQKKNVLIGSLAALIVVSGIFMLSPTLSSRFASIGDTHNQSNSERFLLWKSAYHMFEDHPLVGVGFAQFRNAYQGQYILPEAKERELGHAHSNVMQMLAECGLIGLLALVFFWYAYLSYGFRTWIAAHHVAALLIPAILLGLILQGLTEYNMGNSAVTKLYWTLMGLCLQWLRIDVDGRRLS